MLSALAPAMALNRKPYDEVVDLTIDHCLSGKSYTLMLLTPGTDINDIPDASILYMNIYRASSDKLSVAILYPRWTEFDAVSGGVFSDGSASPRLLGSYKAQGLPEQTVSIGEEAFAGTAYTHLYLGDRVASIGSGAFRNCAKLEYIYIPASVTSIAPDAFDGCDRVTIGCDFGSTAWSYAQRYGFDYRAVS